MKSIRKIAMSFFLAVVLIVAGSIRVSAANNKIPTLQILSTYSKTLAIGESFNLLSINSNLTYPSFKSSKSSVASVDGNGRVTANAPGSCKITVKAGNAESSCSIKVVKTTVSLSKTSVSLECNGEYTLTVSSSTGHEPTFKSTSTSIASVDDDGLIIGKKPGSTYIKVTVDTTTIRCKVTVKPCSINLNSSELFLYAGKSAKLTATVSSGSNPTYKTNKSSVAIVDDKGTITALKHGTAIITVKADGSSANCTVTVGQPTMKFSSDYLTLNPGDSKKLICSVSSGQKPEYSSSNARIATVDANGTVHAKDIGKCYIYAKCDGVKVSCAITVEL